MAKSWRVVSLVLFAFLSAPQAALGQQKVPIYFEAHPGEKDATGRQLQFEIKEAIRGSHAFRLVDDEKSWPYLKVLMVSANDGLGRTAASFTFIYDSTKIRGRGLWVMSALQLCGANDLQMCARTTLGSIDEALRRLKSDSAELHKTLTPPL